VNYGVSPVTGLYVSCGSDVTAPLSGGFFNIVHGLGSTRGIMA
jgi:hypothetical protein